MPYVIDNREHRLADILNALLREFQSRSLGSATAQAMVGGMGGLICAARGLTKEQTRIGEGSA